MSARSYRVRRRFIDWTPSPSPSRRVREAAWLLMDETGLLGGVAAACRFVYSLQVRLALISAVRPSLEVAHVSF